MPRVEQLGLKLVAAQPPAPSGQVFLSSQLRAFQVFLPWSFVFVSYPCAYNTPSLKALSKPDCDIGCEIIPGALCYRFLSPRERVWRGAGWDFQLEDRADPAMPGPTVCGSLSLFAADNIAEFPGGQ